MNESFTDGENTGVPLVPQVAQRGDTDGETYREHEEAVLSHRIT